MEFTLAGLIALVVLYFIFKNEINTTREGVNKGLRSLTNEAEKLEKQSQISLLEWEIDHLEKLLELQKKRDAIHAKHNIKQED